jgi:hypothetical protein
MVMARVVAAEVLDGLDAGDPAAQRSRRDLRRVHRAMRTRSILLRGLAALDAVRRGAEPLRMLELGAGDGTLMLGVARAMARSGLRVQLTLLDRQALLDRSTINSYAQAGWTVVANVAEVADWIAGGASAHWDAIVTNLFLHHFALEELVPMLGAIAARTDLFFACEPRRGWIALAGSHLVGAMGANAVTREDAVLSVRAGFAGHELSGLWPEPRSEWRLREYRAGLFSHCLHATRIEAH